MRYDANGNYIHPTPRIKEWNWWPRVVGEAIPLPFLTTGTGTVSVLGYDTTRAYASCVTGAVIGNSAGLESEAVIDAVDFEEIFFGMFGVAMDASATGTNCNVQLQLSDGVGGAFLFNNHSSAGANQLRVYPNLYAVNYDIMNNGQGVRRKDLGIVIYPRDRVVAVYEGDPKDGAGLLAISEGDWTAPTTKQKVLWRCITQTAAARTMTVEGFRFRLNGTGS